jgi:hypothetical protein
VKRVPFRSLRSLLIAQFIAAPRAEKRVKGRILDGVELIEPVNRNLFIAQLINW